MTNLQNINREAAPRTSTEAIGVNNERVTFTASDVQNYGEGSSAIRAEIDWGVQVTSGEQSGNSDPIVSIKVDRDIADSQSGSQVVLGAVEITTEVDSSNIRDLTQAGVMVSPGEAVRFKGDYRTPGGLFTVEVRRDVGGRYEWDDAVLAEPRPYIAPTGENASHPVLQSRNIAGLYAAQGIWRAATTKALGVLSPAASVQVLSNAPQSEATNKFNANKIQNDLLNRQKWVDAVLDNHAKNRRSLY
jgi:hypothetical protein